MPTLAAARQYLLLGENTTVSANQAIRIYAAASVGMSEPRIVARWRDAFHLHTVQGTT